MKIFLGVIFLSIPFLLFSQDDKGKLGDKEYIIVKDYKPVLGESLKISETPEGDTSTVNPPADNYNIQSRKITSEYELSTIKAIKIKDEQLAKLYRSYLKLGIGNYTTYSQDLYLNALRSKKGSMGLAINNISGDPGISEYGPAGFGETHAGVYGKYFLEKSTFGGNLDYDREVVHYYGYNSDTVINKDDIKQKFNTVGMNLSLGSNYTTSDHLDYFATFGFSSLSDNYDVSENSFMVAGKLGKLVGDKYFNADLSFDYFHKTLANYESATLANDLNRRIITVTPTMTFNKDNLNLKLGVSLALEKNLDSKAHLFPRIDLTVPVAENILYVFGGVNGNIVKNNFQSIVDENPFVTSSVVPENTINKIELKAGMNGNFTSRMSFVAMIKYTTVDQMQLFVNDSVNFNKFNTVYEDGKVLDLHGELSYNVTDQLKASLRFDHYNYSMENNTEAWHKPSSEFALNLKYNLRDKLIIDGSIYAKGKYDVRLQDINGYYSEKVKGYADVNIGIEYKYSKVLSFFVNTNNLGFKREYTWYNYPSERLNVLGGIKFSF